MRIWLIEDEARVLSFLEKSLRAESFETFSCTNLSELIDALQNIELKPDLLILDRMLKGQDSLDHLSKIKSLSPHSKCLILSAINSAEEKAKALDEGADDYLAKPFSLLELVARVRALVRRGNIKKEHSATLFCLGNLSLEALSHQVCVAGKKVSLTSKEYSVLMLLMQRPGQVFSKYQLLDRVWDTQFDIESNVVEATIKKIRKKIEEAGADVQITTGRNVGYWVELRGQT